MLILYEFEEPITNYLEYNIMMKIKLFIYTVVVCFIKKNN